MPAVRLGEFAGRLQMRGDQRCILVSRTGVLRLDGGREPLVSLSTAAVDRDLGALGVSALVGAVTAALFGVCEDSRIGRGRRGS